MRTPDGRDSARHVDRRPNARAACPGAPGAEHVAARRQLLQAERAARVVDLSRRRAAQAPGLRAGVRLDADRERRHRRRPYRRRPPPRSRPPAAGGAAARRPSASTTASLASYSSCWATAAQPIAEGGSWNVPSSRAHRARLGGLALAGDDARLDRVAVGVEHVALGGRPRLESHVHDELHRIVAARQRDARRLVAAGHGDERRRPVRDDRQTKGAGRVARRAPHDPGHPLDEERRAGHGMVVGVDDRAAHRARRGEHERDLRALPFRDVELGARHGAVGIVIGHDPHALGAHVREREPARPRRSSPRRTRCTARVGDTRRTAAPFTGLPSASRMRPRISGVRSSTGAGGGVAAAEAVGCRRCGWPRGQRAREEPCPRGARGA